MSGEVLLLYVLVAVHALCIMLNSLVILRLNRQVERLALHRSQDAPGTTSTTEGDRS